MPIYTRILIYKKNCIYLNFVLGKVIHTRATQLYVKPTNFLKNEIQITPMP